jgi:hypothetical protein
MKKVWVCDRDNYTVEYHGDPVYHEKNRRYIWIGTDDVKFPPLPPLKKLKSLTLTLHANIDISDIETKSLNISEKVRLYGNKNKSIEFFRCMYHQVESIYLFPKLKELWVDYEGDRKVWISNHKSITKLLFFHVPQKAYDVPDIFTPNYFKQVNKQTIVDARPSVICGFWPSRLEILYIEGLIYSNTKNELPSTIKKIYCDNMFNLHNIEYEVAWLMLYNNCELELTFGNVRSIFKPLIKHEVYRLIFMLKQMNIPKGLIKHFMGYFYNYKLYQ